jgi:hypothetical protein
MKFDLPEAGVPTIGKDNVFVLGARLISSGNTFEQLGQYISVPRDGRFLRGQFVGTGIFLARFISFRLSGLRGKAAMLNCPTES